MAQIEKPIVAKLNETFRSIFADKDFRRKWEGIGSPVVAGSPEDFGRLVRTETVRLGRVVRDSGATVD